MTREEERRLIQKVRKNDISAFEQIVREHEKLLYNLALRSLHSPEDAHDAVQETFLKAYTGLSSFRGESKLSVWLCKIVSNVCTDMLRKRKDMIPLYQPAPDGEEEQEKEIPDDRFDPVAVLERKDLGERVRAAVELLPEEFRMPLLLREYADLGYEEISRALSLDIGTVKTRIYRARKKLCALLAKDGNFSDVLPSDSSRGGAWR